MNPADYLDVDSPAQRGKKSKKRRKVERNTKLSRSLDSLKELHGKNNIGCYSQHSRERPPQKFEKVVITSKSWSPTRMSSCKETTW